MKRSRLYCMTCNILLSILLSFVMKQASCCVDPTEWMNLSFPKFQAFLSWTSGKWICWLWRRVDTLGGSAFGPKVPSQRYTASWLGHGTGQCVHPIGSIAWLWFQRHLCMVVNQANPEIIPYLTFPIDTIYNLLNTQQTSCVWSLCNKTPLFAISSWMPYMELGARLHQWKPITIYPNLFYQTVTLQNYFIVMKFK